jgi:hypothetical protein
VLFDQIEFPKPRPMLEPGFPVNGSQDFVMLLHINQANQLVAGGELRRDSLAVLPGPAQDVARDADVKPAERPVCHYVDPTTHESEGRPTGLTNRKRDGSNGVRR